MDKKIFIGSIIAVVMLVLVSFTSVVGYQSVESNSIINSPLFSIRTKRATNEESKYFICDYVGKNKDTTIPFPIYNSRNTLIQKKIDLIRQMDDKTFEQFIELINNKLEERYVFKTLEFLYQLRDDKNQLINLEGGEANDILPDIPSINNWSPFCIIHNILWYFSQVLWVITYLIASLICYIQKLSTI